MEWNQFTGNTLHYYYCYDVWVSQSRQEPHFRTKLKAADKERFQRQNCVSVVDQPAIYHRFPPTHWLVDWIPLDVRPLRPFAVKKEWMGNELSVCWTLRLPVLLLLLLLLLHPHWSGEDASLLRVVRWQMAPHMFAVWQWWCVVLLFHFDTAAVIIIHWKEKNVIHTAKRSRTPMR